VRFSRLVMGYGNLLEPTIADVLTGWRRGALPSRAGPTGPHLYIKIGPSPIARLLLPWPLHRVARRPARSRSSGVRERMTR
jgi:hypothetical protein